MRQIAYAALLLTMALGTTGCRQEDHSKAWPDKRAQISNADALRLFCASTSSTLTVQGVSDGTAKWVRLDCSEKELHIHHALSDKAFQAMKGKAAPVQTEEIKALTETAYQALLGGILGPEGEHESKFASHIRGIKAEKRVFHVERQVADGSFVEYAYNEGGDVHFAPPIPKEEEKAYVSAEPPRKSKAKSKRRR